MEAKRVKKTTRNLGQESRCPPRSLKPQPPECNVRESRLGRLTGVCFDSDFGFEAEALNQNFIQTF
jgi:hypothetical protein